MKRVGRKGRILGTVGSEEDMLDDATQKNLLQAAGITLDVLQDMSDEEKRGTLKAILESSPTLLEKFKKVKLNVNDADMNMHHNATSSMNIDPDKVTPMMPLSVGMQADIVHSDSSDVESTQDPDPSFEDASQLRTQSRHEAADSSLLLQPRQTLLALGRQMLPVSVSDKINKYFSTSSQGRTAQYVLDSDEDTQRYDLEYCDDLMTNSDISTNMEQKLKSGDTIPEIQAVGSAPDSPENEKMDISSRCDGRVFQKEEETLDPGNCDLASVCFRLQPSLESQQGVSLTRIYRKQSRQEKAKFWPSMYAPGHIKDPSCYTRVIQLMFNIYLRQVCRAHKPTDETTAAWGAPVIAGAHVEGCLVAKSSKLCNRLVLDGESDGRIQLKNRLQIMKKVQANVGNTQRKADEDVEILDGRTCRQQEENDSRLTEFSTRSVRQCFQQTQSIADEHGDTEEDDDDDRIPVGKQSSETNKVKSSDEQDDTEDDDDDRISVEKQGPKKVKSSDEQDDNDSWIPEVNSSDEQDDTEDDDDDWIPVGKQGPKTREREVMQTREHEQAGKRKKVKNSTTEFYELNSDRKLMNMSRNLKRTCQVDKQTLIRPECETVLKGHLKYAWSEEESEDCFPCVSNCATRKIVHSDRQHKDVTSKRQQSHSQDTSKRQESHSQDFHLKFDRIKSSDREAQRLLTVSDGEYNNERTDIDLIPPDPSQCQDNSHSGASAHDTRPTALLEKDAGIINSQGSESLLDVHGNLYSTLVSPTTAWSHILDQVASSSSLQVDQRFVKCPDAHSSRSIGLRPTGCSMAEVPELETERKTGPSTAHLTSEGSAELRLISGDMETQEDDDVRCIAEEKDNFTKDSSRAKVGNYKTQSKVRESRKRNTEIRTESDWTDHVKGHMSQKRRRLDYKLEETTSINRNVGESAENNRLRPTTEVSGDSPDDLVTASSYSWSQQQMVVPQEEVVVSDNTCPICGRCFHPSKLEAHASSCGEDNVDGTDQNEQSRCVSCRLQFPPAVLRTHQAACLLRNGPSKRITRSKKE